MPSRTPRQSKKPSAIIVNVHLYEEDLNALDALVEEQRARNAASPSRSKLTRIALRLLHELKSPQLTELLNATK